MASTIFIAAIFQKLWPIEGFYKLADVWKNSRPLSAKKKKFPTTSGMESIFKWFLECLKLHF